MFVSGGISFEIGRIPLGKARLDRRTGEIEISTNSRLFSQWFTPTDWRNKVVNRLRYSPQSLRTGEMCQDVAVQRLVCFSGIGYASGESWGASGKLWVIRQTTSLCGIKVGA